MGETNDIAQMLALLHELQGIDFVRQLRMITERNVFSPLKTDFQIYTVGGEGGEDYLPLLDAARKAVEHGYRVFVNLCNTQERGEQRFLSHFHQTLHKIVKEPPF